MSVAFEIPLQPRNQRLGIILSGLQYFLVVRWNKFSTSWFMDVYDVNNAPVVLGVPLVTGADLLEQFKYLGIGGQMLVQSDGVTDSVPTFAGLGSTGHLYYRVANSQAAQEITNA